MRGYASRTDVPSCRYYHLTNKCEKILEKYILPTQTIRKRLKYLHNSLMGAGILTAEESQSTITWRVKLIKKRKKTKNADFKQG